MLQSGRRAKTPGGVERRLGRALKENVKALLRLNRYKAECFLRMNPAFNGIEDTKEKSANKKANEMLTLHKAVSKEKEVVKTVITTDRQISITKSKPVKNNTMRTEKKSYELNQAMSIPPKKVTRIADYNVGGEIGKGAYSVVKYGTHRTTGKRVAIKIYEKSRIADRQRQACVSSEIKVMKKLNHPNTIQLYDAISTATQLYIVMELVKGKSLLSYVRSKEGMRLGETECMKVFAQIVAGIEYCHRNCVIHRDVKMENVLVDGECNVKIIDFGFSVCTSSTERLKVFCGTPSYMAPEIAMRKEHCGKPSDIWSLGILLFKMLAGHFPFRGVTERDLFKSITSCHFIFPQSISVAAQRLISKMLCLKPESRATIEQVHNEVLSIMMAKDVELPLGLNRSCLRGHELSKIYSADGCKIFTCAICKENYSYEASKKFSCSACKYDICEACATN
eukprot:TRINITY_DN9453_c0_g1_i5.p1 TRINITY_DN9453_c0_g1~~TRINITY_DN9453_c0_g1_i5.p1  ORF type:complete len:451 (-),score=65.85 TRINITY_DN9453_c0_g1_i5:52-1404(-)